METELHSCILHFTQDILLSQFLSHHFQERTFTTCLTADVLSEKKKKNIWGTQWARKNINMWKVLRNALLWFIFENTGQKLLLQ